MKSLTFYLEPNYEKRAEAIPDIVKGSFSSETNLLFMQHQIDTYNANKDSHVTINTYPTGTGKTKASLLHLLDNPKENVLFIAPTNELISQHVRDIKKFTLETKVLMHHVIELNARIIDELKENSELPRRGELLFRLLSNPRNSEFAEKLGITGEKLESKSPIVIVTNPDIFYYAITFNYGVHDKRNIFEIFFDTFDYIVIDEFHYYNSKQLACFLFFISLSLKLGHLKSGKRITILTATPLPEVTKYFERLKEEGLNYEMLEPGNIKPDDEFVAKTLSPVKVTFYQQESFNILDVIKDNLSFIKNKINDNDGAIISNSLVSINDTVNFLKKEGFEDKLSLITGIVKQSSKKPLILATPTVDIGYNFEKGDKERQNLDYLFFDFRYSDEFWQRLGRAGRVLGKTSQDVYSEVVVFASPDEISKLSNHITSEQTISRKTLREILEKNDIFQKRADLTDYLNFYGLSEFAKPLENLRQIFPKDVEHVVTEELFNTISNVYSGRKRDYYRYIRSFNDRFNNLEKSIENVSECGRKVFNDFLVSRNQDKMIEHIDEKKFKEFIKSSDLLKDLENYVKEEYFTIKGLHNFREAFQGLTAYAFDPKNLMNSDKKFIIYDLFHLLKYYELRFFKSKKDFQNEVKDFAIPVSKSEEIFYCEIESRRTGTNISINFSLDINLEKDKFEERYLNRLLAKNNVDFNLTVNEKTGSFNIPSSPNLAEAKKYFREQYIPCLIMNYELIPVCFKYKVRPVDLVVNGITGKYKILLGTSAYLLAPKIDRIRDLFERKTKCYIC